MVDAHVYPNNNKPDRFALYSELLAHFIRDVRKDLNVPKLPFVIGVMGVGGAKANENIIAFREAMTAPALLPEFKGNVTAVPTAPFWSEELGAIDEKLEQVRRMAFALKSKNKNGPNKDGAMMAQEQEDYLKKFEADLISAGRSCPVAARRLQCRIPLPRLCEDVRPDGQSLRRGQSETAGLPAPLTVHHPVHLMKTIVHALATLLLAVPAAVCSAAIQPGEMAGNLFFPAEKVPEEFNGGFSLYVAAWPLVETYPGHRFQSGLCATWMHPQHEEGKAPEGKCYTTIEGGLGWWRDTHFPTLTPKFNMGGVAPNFRWIANGPGHGAGTWEKPRGQYGVAQLSPWLLFPLDGLNLKQGTSGELFGYGYLPLPLHRSESHHGGQ
jgi:hypothetical protein